MYNNFKLAKIRHNAFNRNSAKKTTLTVTGIYHQKKFTASTDSRMWKTLPPNLTHVVYWFE